MTGGADGGTFLGRAVPPSFVRTVVVIAPGTEHPYHAADWADAIVAVEHGEVFLEGVLGGRILVRRGDVLWFAPTPLRALRNGGSEPAVLVAIARPPRWKSPRVPQWS
jgi:quercetin dioxygenase-like cupin family protein